MPSVRYAPLPTANTDSAVNREMEAAFSGDEDEDDIQDASETHPLRPSPLSPSTRSPIQQQHSRTPSAPGTYDFENFDYASIIPPGEPPGPSSTAIPNDFGNSNGMIPDPHNIENTSVGERRGWFRRTAASVLPASAVRRWGLDYETPSGVVGAGTGNDGVFANVTAKPGRNIEIREGKCNLILLSAVFGVT
jgi:hypothetical protein